MANIRLNPNDWSVGTKITVFTFGLVGVIIAALVLTISVTTSSILEKRSIHSVTNELKSVVNMIELYNKNTIKHANDLGQIFLGNFSGEFSLDEANPVDIGGKPVPALKNGGKVLNLDFTTPDLFARQTGGSATIFAASGDEFVRVSTTVKNEDGERAVGTALDHASPAYPFLREGKTFVGPVKLFGKQLMAWYAPLKGSDGKVVGAVLVGMDLSEDMAALKQKIKSIKVGETGYFYVLDATPGKGYGDLVVHPAKEGSNILASKDANGRFFIREILENKQGLIRYDWQNPGEATARDKVVAYELFKDWNWLVAGGTYSDEITREAAQLRTRYIGLGMLAVAVFAVALYLVARATITRPLQQARDAAIQIADGDLTVNMHTSRSDEIGRLTEAMNGISRKLSGLVGQVRDGAEQIASASQEISTGNLDLCTRTERQAANLAATASSMDELTSTVRQNAENAKKANELAARASGVAQQGGAMVNEVIETMSSINQSSRKIADIIGVIDGIAFQTNILALNAAVEAARAGEQGRGFAVVASEVRALAQRSAAASKEIRGLIEASVGQVDAGSKLVQNAGVTMNEVLASVARVSDIMSEISAASAEQRSGIEHVNQSIGQMDEATQQNAALVEQASAAAQAMQDQAAGLARAVRQFKLDQQSSLPGPSERLALTHEQG